MDEVELFRNGNWRVTAKPYVLQFRFPFKLALNTRSFTDIVIICVESGRKKAYGEAALPPYLSATVQSVLSFLGKIDWKEILNADLKRARLMTDAVMPENNAAKAAVEMLLHDLYGQKNQCTVGELYGITMKEPVFSTYTIGISSEKELLEKLKEGKDFKTIKLKLGSEHDKEIVRSFRKHSEKPFCVDVNQGWQNKDHAARMADFLQKEKALFIEQPLPAQHFEETAWTRDRVNIPIFADESVKRLSDLAQAVEAFDGINVKLMKSTGIAEAFEMIEKARVLNLKVVLGAMAESSLGNTAAAHLAPLADWVDLDGPMLTSNDPFLGITYHEGAIVMPNKLGIGVIRNEELV